MTQNRIESVTAQPTVPPILVSCLAVFRPCFTAPVWNHILVLVGGAVLAPGKRTVTQALRVMGLADKPGTVGALERGAREGGTRPWLNRCRRLCKDFAAGARGRAGSSGRTVRQACRTGCSTGCAAAGGTPAGMLRN
jgi:hypothetical protein